MLFSIYMIKTESSSEKKIFVTFGTCEKIEVKRGHLVKKWEFGQTKKKFLYRYASLLRYLDLHPPHYYAILNCDQEYSI